MPGDTPRPDERTPQTLLERPARHTLPGDAVTELSGPEVTVTEPPPPSLPGLSERYRPLSLLGAGGMGEVLLCSDGVIGRDVAMKLARQGGGRSPDRQQRFLREARIQGQLEHPAIVPVYDIGQEASGAHYFTMKRVRGLTLDQILDELRRGDPVMARQYTWRRLLGAFANLCLGIDFAHSRGVVHRDLKPSNVMLGDFGEVYVLDWGLARHLRAPDPSPRLGADEATAVGGPAGITDSGSPAQTAHGVMLGTPGYMSPEQARGENDRLDGRTDVYALGAILFELLALEPLNRTPSSMETLQRTLAGVEARPSVRAPHREVAPELEAICVKATHVDAAQRHPSARALHDEIERFLDGDRDVERRREASRQHAEAARAAQGEARAVQGEAAAAARSRAMREVGRALALDPENRGAVATMMNLLTDPPREVPAGVEAAVRRAELETWPQTGRIGGWLYLSILTFIPLAVMMGVRDWTFGALGVLLFALTGLCSFQAARRTDGRFPTGLLLLSTAAVASTWRTLGTYTLLPGLAALNTLGFVLIGRRENRIPVVLVGMLPILVPALLELVGIIQPSTVFENGNIVILPRLLSLPSGPTHALLLFISLSEVIVGAVLVGRVRDAQRDVELRLQTTLWQLRQLVPEESPPRKGAGAESR